MVRQFIKWEWIVLGAVVAAGASAWADTNANPDWQQVPPSAPPVTQADDDPARFIMTGSVEYQHRFANMIEKGATGSRITVSFEPTVAFLPANITIDLDSGRITDADLTLIRLWIINLLSYHRNTDASVGHDLEFLSANVPILVKSAGGEDIYTTMMVTVGAGTGYRWMTDGESGLYVQPGFAVSATATILNRIFASAYVGGSATAIGGDEPSYLSGVAGGQIAVALNNDNTLRVVLNGSVRYDGANGTTGKPKVSQYLGAGIEWGAPSALVNQSFGIAR